MNKTLSLEFKANYLSACLAIAKTQPRGYYAKHCAGAILVQAHRILAIGYDHPGEPAELMALRQVNNKAFGAIMYMSFAPMHLMGSPPLKILLESQIECLIYGYCSPAKHSGAVLQQLEQTGIPCFYLRVPEILEFYAPFRFGSL